MATLNQMIKIHQGEVKLVDIKKLKPRTNNRNSHPSSQISELARHYEVQGFRNPIIVSNQSGEIVCGTGRLLAAKEAGLKEVPVLYQDYDSPEIEYAHHVADNGLSLWSELDLSAINLDLVDLGPSIQIEDLGIKDFVLDMSDKFDPASIEDQGKLDEKQMTKCPSCGDIFEHSKNKA